MKTYIEEMEFRLNHGTNKEAIIEALETERERCKRILEEYYAREETLGIDCKQICEHEKEIVEHINNILN